MKKVIKEDETPVQWDADALFKKAQRYAETMSNDLDDWEFSLWSSLTLEHLARAALSNVHPALLADTEKGWTSLQSALGFKPTESKFSPKSITIHEVFRRIKAMFPTFTQEMESFCLTHMGRRNAELHSGEIAFDEIEPASWEGDYYRSCETLLSMLGLKLGDLFEEELVQIAKQRIAAAADESAKAVRGDVSAYDKVWKGKKEKEQQELRAAAEAWAARFEGHRVKCPACKTTALVSGDPIAAPTQKLEDNLLIETQEFLPSRFECVACGLKILGLSRLSVVGLGGKYKRRHVYDAAEYYAPDEAQFAGFEDDNNEP